MKLQETVHSTLNSQLNFELNFELETLNLKLPPACPVSLRIDPEQRFSCAQCGRCCRRWDVLVTDAERAGYARRGVARWFRETGADAEGTDHDPFEAVSGWRGYHRIRSRADGACGFLSADNRCRLHEELGGANKPLTCRMFPFKFHPAQASAVVTASFGCPTIVENRGELVSGDATRAGARVASR